MEENFETIKNENEANIQDNGTLEHSNNEIGGAADAARACGSGKKCCKACHILAGVAMCVMFVGLVVLYVLYFTGKSDTSVTRDAEETMAATDGGALRIAYVNTDTLMAGYTYARELQKKIEQVSAQQASLAQQEEQWQADYQNFLQTGENLTLSQQQEKEKELKSRYEKLARLEKQYTDLLPQKQKNLQDELDKMTRAVYNFIADYNAKHERYNLVLAKSYSNTPVLYGDEGMDITQEILEGLNREYAQVKANK